MTSAVYRLASRYAAHIFVRDMLQATLSNMLLQYIRYERNAEQNAFKVPLVIILIVLALSDASNGANG
ncbi:hypothetical protein FRB95_002038 [Tulasnella sp. JGI-2019a]|nr:hypothetical protein FRB95_002038 [Tulasnella sp. JGI-2019a]